MRIYFVIVLLSIVALGYGQVPGSIFVSATPTANPLNPDGDGFITRSGTAFSGPFDEEEFEIPFIRISEFQVEPVADLKSGGKCSAFDIMSSPELEANSSGYYYYHDPDAITDNGDELLIFRLRVGQNPLGTHTYSVLIDTDNKFGLSGNNPDPDAISGNLGFERMISFVTGGSQQGIYTFNVDASVTPIVINVYSLTTHLQKAYALNGDPSCTDKFVFLDFYIPFTDLGILSSTPIRMALASSISPQDVLKGKASDVGGINGNDYANDDEQFLVTVNNYLTTTFTNKPPKAINAAVSINENSLNGTLVHYVIASDPDAPVVLHYSIVRGNTGSAFAIDNVGLITVSGSSYLDLETTPTFILKVRVSDGALYDYATITISLNNVNEAPVAMDATVSIDEKGSNGTFIHKVNVNDSDANEVLFFSLESGNTNSAFSLDAGTGEISINDSDQFDFYLHPFFELLVLVKDRGGLTDDAIIRVELKNIPETSDINPLKGFSPNGDGVNDFWLVKGIEAYHQNSVKVFNRWGNLVYESSNYDNNQIAWYGESNGRLILGSTHVLEGTYFFIIRAGEILEPITGYLIVKQ